MDMSRRYGLWNLAFCGVVFFLPSTDLAQTRITASGLNTQVSGPIAVGGQTHFHITGRTRL
jgi:hypothetical protein